MFQISPSNHLAGRIYQFGFGERTHDKPATAPSPTPSSVSRFVENVFSCIVENNWRRIGEQRREVATFPTSPTLWEDASTWSIYYTRRLQNYTGDSVLLATRQRKIWVARLINYSTNYSDLYSNYDDERPPNFELYLQMLYLLNVVRFIEIYLLISMSRQKCCHLFLKSKNENQATKRFFYIWRVSLTSLGSVELNFVKSSPKKKLFKLQKLHKLYIIYFKISLKYIFVALKYGIVWGTIEKYDKLLVFLLSAHFS